MSLRDRFLRAVQAEQARIQRQVIDEVVRLGGVPGTPMVVKDGKLTERATPSLRP